MPVSHPLENHLWWNKSARGLICSWNSSSKTLSANKHFLLFKIFKSSVNRQQVKKQNRTKTSNTDMRWNRIVTQLLNSFWSHLCYWWDTRCAWAFPMCQLSRSGQDIYKTTVPCPHSAIIHLKTRVAQRSIVECANLIFHFLLTCRPGLGQTAGYFLPRGFLGRGGIEMQVTLSDYWSNVANSWTEPEFEIISKTDLNMIPARICLTQSDPFFFSLKTFVYLCCAATNTAFSHRLVFVLWSIALKTTKMCSTGVGAWSVAPHFNPDVGLLQFDSTTYL